MLLLFLRGLSPGLDRLDDAVFAEHVGGTRLSEVSVPVSSVGFFRWCWGQHAGTATVQIQVVRRQDKVKNTQDKREDKKGLEHTRHYTNKRQWTRKDKTRQTLPRQLSELGRPICTLFWYFPLLGPSWRSLGPSWRSLRGATRAARFSPVLRPATSPGPRKASKIIEKYTCSGRGGAEHRFVFRISRGEHFNRKMQVFRARKITK